MTRPFAFVGIVVAVTFGLSACSSSSKQTTAKRPPQPPVNLVGHTHVDVDAQYNLFTPPDIIINPGTTVTWHNRDTVAHNIQKSLAVVDFGAKFGVQLADFGPGATYSFTFDKVGNDFFYTCTIHTGMNGHVVVVAPAKTTTTKP